MSCAQCSPATPRGWLFLLAGVLVAAAPPSDVRAAGMPEAADVLAALGTPKGVCAVLGRAGSRTATDLARTGRAMVFLQVAGPEEADAARQAAREAGLLGAGLFVSEGSLDRIHLAENVADALVAAGPDVAPRDEVLRVLRPGGTAFLGGERVPKPVPDGVGAWTHHYHGPDNNPQCDDRLARAPYLTQFVASPRYAPAPQATVACNGRVYLAFGHVAWHRREEPWLNTLIAVSGYNGTMLWRRALDRGVMVDRCNLVATPDALYLGTPRACLVLDGASGKVRDEITLPGNVADGPFWKWLALADGRLIALLGADERPDANATWRRNAHGWPWNGISNGYNADEYRWGFGRTLVALDPVSKKVLWRHREERPIDGRGLCMAGGRIFLCRFGEYLACLDAETGKQVWRRTAADDPDLFAKIGPYRPGHGYIGGWKSTVFLRCTDRAIYFLGPQVHRLTAVSAADGRFLWQYPDRDLHIVIRDDALYTIGPQKSRGLTRKLDPLTGKFLASYPAARRACARSVGTPDGIIFRKQGGSQRLDLATGRMQYISSMRPPCHTGVIVSDGHLYWGPWVCDCNLQMYGLVACGPAGDFDFDQAATEADRLQPAPGGRQVTPLPQSAGDWPTYRHDPARTARTDVAVPEKPTPLWTTDPLTKGEPTAPVCVGGLVLVAGADGAVHALAAADGRPRWTALTGGPIGYPPTVAAGRALVGSADGWAYAFEAATGRRLWRFRAAPRERRIRVYDRLISTWPVSSGVLVAGGVAYLACGINNYDGTHVYALDAATGRIRWQNNTSGHLDAFSSRGVAAQGDLLLDGKRLYLAGGNAVSPGAYRIKSGKCVAKPPFDWEARAPRGRELTLQGERVKVSGQPLYATPENRVFDRSVGWAEPVVHAANARLRCDGGKDGWVLRACDPDTDASLWTVPLPGPPVRWGLAVDRDGRIVVSLRDGRLVAFGKESG